MTCSKVLAAMGECFVSCKIWDNSVPLAICMRLTWILASLASDMWRDERLKMRGEAPGVLRCSSEKQVTQWRKHVFQLQKAKL